MVSLPETMVLWFGMGVPVAVGMLVARHFGLWTGIVAWLLSAVVCAIAAILFHRVQRRKIAERRRQWKERYNGIYRVIDIPPDEKSIKKVQGA